ncbi:MAG: DNA polymerase [Gordonia sp. (in: high G+C Gram-positive bacteria)]|uniref:DNA polymerase n=1 Tax=Gordonia sp. (in: high G+C Gram-positive bacteria) TaxID=84139 RepID=UPI0039E6633C
MRLVFLDLETADADRLYFFEREDIRLAGYAVDDGPVVTTTDIESLVALLSEPDVIAVGHNILSFDLPALARCYGLDLDAMVARDRVIDTLLVARQVDPPLSSNADGRVDGRDLGRYGLDALSKRVLGEGKVSGDGGSVLEAMAAEYGGYDKIPVDHPDYVRYLVQDVELVRALSEVLVVDRYVMREHRVLHWLNRISEHGFRVDVDLARRWIAEQTVRVEARKRDLHERYGLPLEGKAPQRSTAGIKALERAFADCGVEPPRTAKGNLATGKGVLAELIDAHLDNTALIELCRTLLALNGERSVPQTILDHTGPDGRVHPSVDARQATGRISLTRPGLTVMGKRDRANICERALLLPDEGHRLLCVDLSTIDGRAVGMHCQDPDYIAMFAPGKDLHDEMAAAVFGEDGWDRALGEHHPRRGEAKAVSHATNYGMGAAGLSVYAGIGEDEAKQQLATLAAKFPRLAAWKDWIREQARSQVLTTIHGRRVRIQPGKEYTQGPAFMGQGIARDLMMQGVLALPEWLLPCLRAVVHDELVFSIPADRIDEGREAVLDALQFPEGVALPNNIPVPILAEAGDVGRDWADCYRSEKRGWPEVARAHRETTTCDDPGCTWHRTETTNK